MYIYVINLSTIKFDKKRKYISSYILITVKNWIENNRDNPENALLDSSNKYIA